MEQKSINAIKTIMGLYTRAKQRVVEFEEKAGMTDDNIAERSILVQLRDYHAWSMQKVVDLTSK